MTTATVSMLAAALADSLTSSTGRYAAYDAETGEWVTRSWPEVYAHAEAIARERLAGTDGAVGLVGDPSQEFVATIVAAWLAGRSVSIMPGPVRGADPRDWARVTLDRFGSIGVTTVFANGSRTAELAAIPGAAVHELAALRDIAIGEPFAPVPLAPDAPAVLQHTAGSTGTPRTAVVSASALLANSQALGERLDLGTDDIGFSWLPLYHDMGLIFLTAGLIHGIPLWLVPNTAFAAAPFRWLSWLTESRATITAAPNFAYDILGKFASRLTDAELSRLRVAISGGEPIDCDAFARFVEQTERFGFGAGVPAPAYGLAEATCAVTMPAAGEGAHYDEVEVTVPGEPTRRRRYALLGTAVTGMEVRIVPASGEVPQIRDRVVGEVEIRGTSMMSGYLDAEPIDPQAWFKTGDIGYLLDGRLVICGRAKELVIVAGRNLFPIELERAAARVSGVRGGGVVAFAAETGSARAGLVLVAEHRGRDAAAARSAVSETVAAECGVLPAKVVFVKPDSLPRTTSGKLRRLEVKRLFESGAFE